MSLAFHRKHSSFQQLLLAIVDLGPNLEAAIRSFEGTDPKTPARRSRRTPKP